ncbi:MAG: 30S ribosomal protein S2 [Patescibacteria group bacterium]|nr:30S ribosomal protein S2 [Patescibacteria group bacterium]
MPENDNSPLVEELFKVGAHFGFSRSRRHATMKPLVYGSKNRTDILDLTKTAPLFEEALTFVKGLGAHSKVVLFVGGKAEMQDIVKKAAVELKMPYVAGRWLGGTLTNFAEIKKRIKRMQELSEEKEAGSLAKKYTKKERVLFDREIARLEERFFGLASMDKLPDALIVVDTRHEAIPVAEANALGIPVVGIMNSDCDFSQVTHPIVGNDASQAAVEFFLDKVVAAYREGAKGNVASAA